jgi:hypothetical protein
MTNTPMQPAATEGRERRTIHLSAYVGLGIDDVVDLLSSRSWIEARLATAVVAVLGADAADLALDLSTVTRISAASASCSVSWTVRNGNEQLVAGHAGVAILLVQSGADPLTELLLTIEVEERNHSSVARALHAILDRITAGLEGA